MRDVRKIDAILKGLEILRKDLEADTAAEHDQFFVYHNDRVMPPVSEEDRAALEKLGWMLSEDDGSWSIFT